MQEQVTERMRIMPEEKAIIEKITELLFKEELITLEEKIAVSKLIKEAKEK